MPHEDNQEERAELRRKAEEQLEGQPGPSTAEMDSLALVHELQVHQAELELQNEELRCARTEVEDLLRKFADLYDFAPVGYFTLDKNGKVIRANLTGAKLLGVKRVQLVGKPIWPYVARESRRGLGEFLSKMPEDGTRHTTEAVFLYNLKEPFWVLIEGIMIQVDDSEHGMIRLAITDITDRKQAEQALQAAHDALETRVMERTAELSMANLELQAFISSIADGMIMVDANGRILLVNDTVRKMLDLPLGHQSLDWIADYAIRNVDNEPISFEETPFRLALEGTTLRDFRLSMVTPSGREMILSVSAAPVRDPVQGVVGAVYVLRDVRERIDFERRLGVLYDREHHIAETLQQAMLPARTEYVLGGCEIAVCYEPASKEAEVGGDFFDVFDMGGGLVGALIGDVTGKGLRAATQAVAARHVVRSYAYLHPSPALVMTLVNRAFAKSDIDETFMLTALFMVHDSGSGVLSYCNAGHEPPMLRDRNGTVTELTHSGMVLGVSEEYAYTEASLSLNRGDTIVAVTDGITEARTPDKGLFGKEGVMEYLSLNPDAPVDEIAAGLLEAARSFAGGRLQDDVVILALSRGGGGW